MLSEKKVLILAPHTDDGELGCGGSISVLTRQDCDIHYVAFSACEESVPKAFPADILRKEIVRATSKLGIPKDQLYVDNFSVRCFDRNRQDILDKMIEYRRMISPDIVFVPSRHDIHQDHQVIFQEALRAFKRQTILSYELPWNLSQFHTQFFVELSEEDLCRKMTALAEYKSQSHREYFTPSFMQGLAAMRGTQASCKYAEAFEVVKIILKN